MKEFESLSDVLDDLDARGVYGYHRYKAVNRYISLKARFNDIPVSGSFELTPLCNFDCKMCYVHLKPEQMSKGERVLQVDEWKKIIRQAVDAGMMYASLTGGECLTHPAFKEIYLYLVSLGIQPDVLTNGELLTKEMVDFFVKYPPGVIQVTIYGSNEDAYEAVTGHRAFQRVMNGIACVQEAGLNLFLTVSPSIFMKDDVKPLLELVHSFNVPYAIGDTTLKARAETEREMADYAVDLATLRQIKLIEREFHTTAARASSPIYAVEYVPPRRSPLKGLPCGGAHSSFHVNWKGEVCPCIGFAESVHSSALENGFAGAFKQVQQIMYNYRQPNECCTCELKDRCLTCPAEKTQCVFDGQLNTLVCQRLRQYQADCEEQQMDTCTLL